LERTLDTISKTAGTQLRAHLGKVHATEEWIVEGIHFDSGDRCPYCSQEIARSEIALVFSSYFSASYKQVKRILNSDLLDLQQRIDTATTIKIKPVFESNRSRLLQWSDFLPASVLNLDLDLTTGTLRMAHLVLKMLAEKKWPVPIFGSLISQMSLPSCETASVESLDGCTHTGLRRSPVALSPTRSANQTPSPLAI